MSSTPFSYPAPTSSRQPLYTTTTRLGTMQTRLKTAQSRPGTARPATGLQGVQESSFILAVIEGRGISREVGLAALERDTGKVILVQLVDCQTYVKTLHQMHLHYPSLILVPNTFLSQSGSTTLVECMEEEFLGTPIDAVERRFWNDSVGLEFINQLCVENEERPATLLAVSTKYYALSAACALFKHAETKLNSRFAPGSLRIHFRSVEGTMLIDPDTVKTLELIGNVTHRKSSHSLFGIMNFTHTPMGARLLRANILSPLTTQYPLEARLDVVQELIQSEDRFSIIRDALKGLNRLDFDKLIVSLATSETVPAKNAKPAAARVAQLLNLRIAVKTLPSLHRALEGSRHQLLNVAHQMLSDVRLWNIEQLVASALNDDIVSAKGGIGAVNARVYAVKANQNKLLDVARETYKENVGDIFELASSLSTTHDLPIQLFYRESAGGFVFSVKKAALEGGEIPPGFIDVTVNKGKVTFSSLDLKKMNARMKDALDETLMLSEKIIHDLVDGIVANIGALYKASEAVALVDMLWSFAHISILRNYVRPEFTGTLAIKKGRHPMLETIQAAGTLVPNDAYADDTTRFQIVQGPNMSGKSTYIRQIGLLTVMAMCGCFVPAEYASFRLHDALLTRLSNNDDLERALSTFASEMASSAMILGLATSMTLILIDELGRGTSPREGVGIAHAIAEGLIQSKAFIFFATHFAELATTLSRQPSVVNLYLAVQKSRKSVTSLGLTFRYRIIDGVPEGLGRYGLELAQLADLPPDVITHAERISSTLADLQSRHEKESESSKIAERRKAVLRLKTTLTQLHQHSRLSDQDLLAHLAMVQKQTMKSVLDAM